jgi:hypothetical protein
LLTLNISATHQFVGVVSLCTAFYFLSRGIPLILKAFWFWCLLGSVWVAFSPFYMPDYMPEMFIWRTKWSCAQACVLMILFPIVGLYLPIKWYKIIFNIWAVWECYILLTTGNGLENGQTFCAALLILTLPVTFPLIWPLMLFTAFKFGGSTALFVGLGMLLAYLAPRIYKVLQDTRIALATAAVGAAVTYFAWDKVIDLFDSSQRVPVWITFYKVWRDNFPKIQGIGVGSWEWLGAFIDNPAKQSFIWVHNDYLQVLFEAGVVGFILLILSVAWVLWNARLNAHLRALSWGVAICMISYFPLHFAISQLLVLYVIRGVLVENQVKVQALS